MSKKKGRDFKNKHKLVKGKLDITRSGIGYVIVEGVEKDIFIRCRVLYYMPFKRQRANKAGQCFQ